jgi:hypothetical protein
MSEREYRAVGSSYPAPRNPYDDYNDDDYLRRRTSRRDYTYDEPYSHPRGSGDTLSRTTTRSEHGSMVRASAPPSATKTTYRVARDRDAKVIVLDSRLSRDRELADWEVIRPERSESGAYIIETSSSIDYDIPNPAQDIDYDARRRPDARQDFEVLSTPRGRRQRSLSRGTLEAMREVRVTEDYSSDDDRRNTPNRRTGRATTNANTSAAVVAPPLRRLSSSIRHDHSPESVTRRRTRSIGFIKDQIKQHDASESKHERPGAEANIAGRYLIDHRGEKIKRKDDDDDLTSVGGYPLRKSQTERLDTYGAEVERRRRTGYLREEDGYEEDENRGRREPYPPQRDRRKYRRDDDDESRYSEYYDKRTNRSYR